MKKFKDNIKTKEFAYKERGGLFPNNFLDYSNKKCKYMKISERNKKIIRILKFIDKIHIINLKIIFSFLLFPLTLSMKNSSELRKLNTDSKISIVIVGSYIQSVLSQNSKIMPSLISYKTYTYPISKIVTFSFDYKEHNISMDFNFTSSDQISFRDLFSGLTKLKGVDLSKFDLQVNDTSYMFKDCEMLEYVYFGNFDTSLVTGMEYMFYNTNLTFLDLSKFNTQSVTTMNYMFSKNNNLLYINLKDFDVSQVTQMKNMFYKCPSLMFIYFGTFSENSLLDITNIFLETKDDLNYCILEETQKIMGSLSEKDNAINICNHSCF